MATFTVNPGDSIQAAINQAAAGDTIRVSSGVYNESITINKAIILEGPNKGIAPEVPDINVTQGIDVNKDYRTNAEAWIKGTITVAADDVTIDGFRLRNEGGTVKWQGTPDDFQLLNNYVTGYIARNAPTFGNANSNNPTNVVTGWNISGNYIGGLTGGTGGAMNLAGLSDSNIDNNTFWRPRAAHLYLASLTNVSIEGNNFYHGLHTAGFNEDGLAQYFSGAQGGYVRNYWFELKGTNNNVDVLNNKGEHNSGGIQLYSEPNQANPFIFNNITIEGNDFPSSNFTNPFPQAPTNGSSGLIPAVMATAAVGGASGSNLIIDNNTVSLNLSQVRYATDHFSSLEVRGSFNGVTVEDNKVTQTGTNTNAGVTKLTGLNLYGGLSGEVLVQNNEFNGSVVKPQGDYYGIDFMPTSPIYGVFTGELDIVSNNTISNWKDGAFLSLDDPGPDVSDSINVSGNTFSQNERNVFDQIAPEISTTFISYPENQTNQSLAQNTVVATDNLANTDNVGIRQYSISDPNPNDGINITALFQINPSTGVISLTEAGLASAANDFEVSPNNFDVNITVTDGGGITTTQNLRMAVQNANEQVEVDPGDFEPGQPITPPTPDTASVFRDTPQALVFVPSTGSDTFDLNGGADLITGTPDQFNGDTVLDAIPITTIRVTGAAVNSDDVEVLQGSAILKIDTTDNGTSDTTITLEGDFTEALFLVNPDATANTTDINFDILNARVNRFQNEDRPGTYLFAGEAESQNIRDNFPQFKEEGYAFKVTTTDENDRLLRFNRFQNSALPGTYLFANEAESESIRTNYPQFVEEGEGAAFYAAAPGSSTGESIYRFQNTQQPGTYIFVGEQERNSIIANYPQFTLEGEAFEIVV